MISQEARILNAIKDSGKRGIANYKLSRYALQYNRAIHDLRAEGHNIVCERVYNWRGKATGTFKYLLRDDT